MINFDSLKKGDWLEVKDIDGETLSFLLFIRRDLDDFFFHTFYFVSRSTKSSRWHLNDKWFRYEIKNHEIISYDEVKKYFGDMFNTLFEGKIGDGHK